MSLGVAIIGCGLIGQKRAKALGEGRLVACADEPTLGLDTGSIGRFGVLLAAHRAGGGMVVAATHVPLPLPGAGELAL
jgi:heme exporter protein A